MNHLTGCENGWSCHPPIVVLCRPSVRGAAVCSPCLYRFPTERERVGLWAQQDTARRSRRKNTQNIFSEALGEHEATACGLPRLRSVPDNQRTSHAKKTTRTHGAGISRCTGSQKRVPWGVVRKRHSPSTSGRAFGLWSVAKSATTSTRKWWCARFEAGFARSRHRRLIRFANSCSRCCYSCWWWRGCC